MNSSQSQGKQVPQSSSAPEQAAMELMKLGPEHAQLAKMVGSWKVAVTHWMKEGVEPTKSEGNATFTKVFDGRFIQEEFKGDFQGKSFIGIGTTGFDRAAKRIVNTWYDNMGTGIISSNGTSSEDHKEQVLRGTMTCPMRGQVNVRHVYAHESDDKFTLTMYSESEGKESRSMELIYTRAR